MNLPTLIVLLVVLGLAAFVVVRLARKKGGGCAGGCAGCPHASGKNSGTCPHCAGPQGGTNDDNAL